VKVTACRNLPSFGIVVARGNSEPIEVDPDPWSMQFAGVSGSTPNGQIFAMVGAVLSMAEFFGPRRISQMRKLWTRRQLLYVATESGVPPTTICSARKYLSGTVSCGPVKLELTDPL
jgi:hypothetical protein